MTDFLSGVRVAEFGQYIAAPAAGAQLAALGADVVKVEPLEGEVCRHLGVFGAGIFNAHNAGKRSLALNLRSTGGVDAARRLIAASDVVVQNLRPGGMTALGLGHERMRAENPRLIYASVTGYGPRGPSNSRPGLDIAAQAESGLMWIVGEKGGEPLRVTAPVVDGATGHVLTQAILAALFHRERTGDGAHVEVSLLDVAIHLQATMFQEYQASGTPPERTGNGMAVNAPAADLIRTRDGYLVLSAYTPTAWKALCTVIGRPELTSDPRFVDTTARVRHRPELLAILDDVFGGRDTEEAVRWLTEAGLVAGSVRDYPKVLAAEDVVASGIIGNRPDGSFTIFPPYQFGGERPGTLAPIPAAGAHTREVLGELAFAAEDIDHLLHEGAVGPRAEVTGGETVGLVVA